MSRGDTLIDIMVKRERLLARCSAQRDDLAAIAQQWQGPLQVADRVVAAVQYLRRHPLVLGAAVAMAAVIERRHLWKWGQRGFVAWRTYGLLKASLIKSAD